MAFGTFNTLLTGSRFLVDGCVGDLQASKATHWVAFPM